MYFQNVKGCLLISMKPTFAWILNIAFLFANVCACMSNSHVVVFMTVVVVIVFVVVVVVAVSCLLFVVCCSLFFLCMFLPPFLCLFDNFVVFFIFVRYSL